MGVDHPPPTRSMPQLGHSHVEIGVQHSLEEPGDDPARYPSTTGEANLSLENSMIVNSESSPNARNDHHSRAKWEEMGSCRSIDSLLLCVQPCKSAQFLPSDGGLISHHPPHRLRELFVRFVGDGGSATEAWITVCSARVTQVLLTMPTSYAQMGYGFAITFQLLYECVGQWTSYLLDSLYKEYCHRRKNEGGGDSAHDTQYHEMMGHLAGKWVQHFSLLINILAIIGVLLSQLATSASTVYILNPELNKRQWTYVMGAGMLLIFLSPSTQNYRLLSFVALGAATYTAWYMTIAALIQGQVVNVNHTGAADLQFFTGTTNLLFAFSAHSLSIHTMQAMRQPQKYNRVLRFTSLYAMSITIPHSLALFWAFGDILLDNHNTLALLPDSSFRTIAIIATIVQQMIGIGLFSHPLNVIWEKTLGVHEAGYLLRLCCRLPLVLLIAFLAVAFPFFGLTNSLVGAVVVSFLAAIIPCAVHVYTFRTSAARQNAAKKPTKWLPGWNGMLAVNLSTIVVIASLGVGVGGWASGSTFADQIRNGGLFNKCYECNSTFTVQGFS